MRTKIPYATDSWNPYVGCTHVSPACDNCWAEDMAARIIRMNPNLKKYLDVTENGAWTGNIGVDPDEFLKPFTWKKPRRIFVCDMGDVFYIHVPFDLIDKLMSVIALLPQHTFLILTKRPGIMKKYFDTDKEKLIERWADQTYELGVSDNKDDTDAPACWVNNRLDTEWPMKNLWLGVTCENQNMANYRIPILLHTPASKRFVSYEPALGPIDFTRITTLEFCGTKVYHSLHGMSYFQDIDDSSSDTPCNKLDWIIMGAESGPKRREMNIEWAETVKNQCERHNIPFFFKQKFIGRKKIEMPILSGKVYDQIPQ